MGHFDILLTDNSFFQLELDFKHLHPAASGNLLSEWTQFIEKLEQVALSSRIDDEVGKELVKKLKSDADDQLLDPSKFLIYSLYQNLYLKM